MRIQWERLSEEERQYLLRVSCVLASEDPESIAVMILPKGLLASWGQ